ncbi:MAG: biotin carboxylase N-terminal domain-containing protein [Rhodanobacteraceae bacterium]
MFKRVLIANRGEIACRVIRTCRRLGIHSIAVYSEADARAQHVLQADEAWPIGGPSPADSYLRIDRILDVARQSGAEAIHPGYGFLSENARFARDCAEAGVVFVGPKPESIEAMGSKARAKAMMESSGVPLVPGYHGEKQDSDFLAAEAGKIGFPLMIKAASGGGGKGMRIVRTAEDFVSALQSAQREASNAFADQRMILERYIEHPRHIEFQIFADNHGHTVHLNERECSAQRRYQKVLEETPSPFLDDKLRDEMGKAAIAAARAVNYLGAGTIEFIVAKDGSFHFMEMNTRLQVEHPVTEMTLGLDLVELQLRVAAGQPLPDSLIRNKAIPAQGHAIEVRLYAEDPDNNFLPASGHLDTLALPATSSEVRIDSGVVEGDNVSIHYDPMIAKLIVRGPDRPRALLAMQQALAQCTIGGLKSNIAFLERLIRHPVVVDGRIDTGYLDRHLDEFLVKDELPPPTIMLAALAITAMNEEAGTRFNSEDPHSPWTINDTWRVGEDGERLIAVQLGGQRVTAALRGHDGDYIITHEKTGCTVRSCQMHEHSFTAEIDGTAHRIPLLRANTAQVLHDTDGRRWTFSRAAAFSWDADDGAGGNSIIAPMPGRIVVLKAAAGDQVDEGDELLVMEAMKMELSLKAPCSGRIDSINASEGDFVDADAVLVSFVDEADE